MITLLHPSRSRPAKSFETTREWIEKAGCAVELLVSLDEDDPMIQGYFERYKDEFGNPSGLTISNNKSVVEATNRIAKDATYRIMVYLSDDFKCPDDWGKAVIKEFKDENRPLILKIEDGLQRFDKGIITMPIMNRALYERLGYFWHPEYKSMFVDEDLYWTCHKMGAIKNCGHLKFPHEHHSIGKAENDETYQRSEANYQQGKRVYQERRKNHFV